MAYQDHEKVAASARALLEACLDEGPFAVRKAGQEGPKSATSGYLPIEELRKDALKVFRGGRVVRTFRSSGTTQSERSQSHFSAEGLALYRAASVAAFFEVLGRVLPGRVPQAVRGISLIPGTDHWPESSLAQMVAWIAEVANVTYATDESLPAILAGGSDEPIWLFATAFHLLNTIDAGAARALAPGSLVIETGGTKGKSRSVTRTELFREISAAFGVPESRIVSEYGMCEMASQAYDWVEPGDEEKARRFRFPTWATPFVLIGPSETSAVGDGVLALADRLRVDLPGALRTEDRVQLNEDGSFVLKGRVPAAPLKGCSLNAEAVAPREVVRSAQRNDGLVRTWDEEGVRARAARVAREWGALVRTRRLEKALEHEIGSATMAKTAVLDLERSAPKSEDEWVLAAAQAVGAATDGSHRRAEFAARWLIILPKSHGMAAFHPLLIGWIAGVDLLVRLPERDGVPQILVQWLGLKVVTGARLGDATLTDDAFDAVLLFGSDDTVATIRSLTARPVVGFGSRIGMSLVDASRGDAVVGVAADALALAQSGCMSTRLVIASGANDVAGFAKRLQYEARKQWSAPLPDGARLALELEQWRYVQLGFALAAAPSVPLVPYKNYVRGEDFASWPALRPFTIPVVAVDKSEVKTLMTALLQTRGFGTVTHNAHEDVAALTKSDYGLLSFRCLGEANAPVWSGAHEGRALFVVKR